jgi:capsular exopolysaccharide synthesis family protein
MRKPRLHKIFQVAPNPGLSNLLADEGVASLADAARSISEVENLSLLPCGPLPPNPAELLQGNHMERLLEEIGDLFDVAVFDTPPLVSVTDAAVLSQYICSVVLVIRSFSTQREIVSHAKDIITETKSRVLGLVLNNADAPRTSYQAYYYGYIYGYGDDEDTKKARNRRRRKAAESGGNGEPDDWRPSETGLAHVGRPEPEKYESGTN